MNRIYTLLISFTFISSIYVSCQIVEIEDNRTVAERAYCFRFTWLGPKYNDESQFKNATCGDIVKDDKSVPCTHPLVVTNNSNIPDTIHIWNEYRNRPSQIGCRLVKGEVCAKFSYTFNGAVENITYICTKVNIENETAVNDGCYKQVKSGHEVEVCVCQSYAGRMPCNSGNDIRHALITFMTLIVMLKMF